MQKRVKQPGSGQAKVTPTRSTRTVKDVLAATFNELQTMEGEVPKYPGARLLDWAIREPGEFYRVAAWLIPTEASGAPPLTVNMCDLGSFRSPTDTMVHSDRTKFA